MKNRYVGYLIVGIAVLMGFVIYSFNHALEEIVSTACSHGQSCPMWGTISLQTSISLGMMAFIAFVGLYFVFFSKEEKREGIKIKKIVKEDYQDVMMELSNDEKLVFEKILESEGIIFQSDLVDKSNLQKVKITRLLDRLEGKGLIERKRRGMTNIVILKHHGSESK
ncbi:MAG: MarR family transcriptional regulator [Nanoarchaeota archaeon]|nr:MarR family transcriptional regulator [Nanoarchaeota archaeon]